MNDKLSRALQKDELYQYLIGAGDYYFHPEMADLPTDPLVAFYYIEEAYTKDPNLLDRFCVAVTTMSNDAEFSWFSLYYLLSLLNFLRARGINRDVKELVERVPANVAHQKSALAHNKAYEGRHWKDGLWGDVTRLASIIEKDFNFTMTDITQRN